MATATKVWAGPARPRREKNDGLGEESVPADAPSMEGRSEHLRDVMTEQEQAPGGDHREE